MRVQFRPDERFSGYDIADLVNKAFKSKEKTVFARTPQGREFAFSKLGTSSKVYTLASVIDKNSYANIYLANDSEFDIAYLINGQLDLEAAEVYQQKMVEAISGTAREKKQALAKKSACSKHKLFGSW
ncbi:MAG: hypothetical protein ACXWT0_03745 [Methylobacter sp.]